MKLNTLRFCKGGLGGFVEPQFLISQISYREKLVPIRHVFHTNIVHFVKLAHLEKLYAAHMRILHIDRIPPNLLHFAFDSNSSYIWQDLKMWFNQVTDKISYV